LSSDTKLAKSNSITFAASEGRELRERNTARGDALKCALAFSYLSCLSSDESSGDASDSDEGCETQRLKGVIPDEEGGVTSEWMSADEAAAVEPGGIEAA
jgi:hypothetical protein